MKSKREDYLKLFPYHKRLFRSNLLRKAAELAAGSISQKIESVHGNADVVSSLVGEARAEKYVNDYIDNVIEFKMNNGIGPENRIEAPKIAAILIAQLYQEPITNLFAFKTGYEIGKSPYPNVVRGTFFNRLAYACLGLPKNFVNEGLGQDLHQILVTEDVSNERLMSVLFKGVFWARGVEADCLED